jgi:ABC-type branched-subunit amino acid transport system substrate-binding protein
MAFDENDVWVGTVKGLSRGSNLKRWNHLSPLGDEDKTDRLQPGEAAPGKRIGQGGSGADFISIALLGPIVRPIALPGEHRSIPTNVGRADPLAVQSAVDQMSVHGNTPIILATGAGEYERYGWGSPDDDFALFLHRDKASGIVAHVGPDQTIRSAIALKTEVPGVNTSTDPPAPAELANPWIFRCPVDDPRQHARMMDYIINDLGHKRLAVLRGPDAVARRHLDLWSRYAESDSLSNGVYIVTIDYDPTSDQPDDALRKLAQCDAHAVLTWYDCVVSASLVRQMRKMDMPQLFVGSEHVVSDEFIELAGTNPGPVLAFNPCQHRRDRESLALFVKRHTAQSSSRDVKREPAVDAYVAYHATRHLLEAIDRAGHDRYAVRRMLARMNQTRIAVLKDGQWQIVTASQQPAGVPLP